MTIKNVNVLDKKFLIAGVLGLAMVALGVFYTIAQAANVVTVTPIPGSQTSAIGIDWLSTSNQLLISDNYDLGTPHNFDTVDRTSGLNTQWGTASGWTQEIYFASVRPGQACNAPSCSGSWTVGDVFSAKGGGDTSHIAHFNSAGTSLPDFATLPGETKLKRGGMTFDRYNVPGLNGDLLVLAADDTVGPSDVYKVDATGAVTHIATLPDHAEGIATIPNLPAYGPWAGKILVGEEFASTGSVATIDPVTSAVVQYPFVPPLVEDIWVIPAGSDFYGVDHSLAKIWTADASQWTGLVGKILLATETNAELWTVEWNGSSFVYTEINAGFNSNPREAGSWEHITFAPTQTRKTDSSTHTDIHNASHSVVTSVPVGTSVHDNAQVTPTDATGTVSFQLYSGTSCQQPNGAPEVVAVGAGGIAESSAVTANAAMSYKATYSGDSKYNGSEGLCEPLEVTQNGSSTHTDIHNASHSVVTSVPVGTSVHDNAQVTPTDATGTVSFQLYSGTGCEVTNGAAQVVAVGAGGIAESSSTTANAALSYRATYSGDNKYSGSVGACENLTITKLDSSTATEIHDTNHTVVTSVNPGTTVHDKAIVTPNDATGTVSFQLYSDANCQATNGAPEVVALSGATAESSNVVANAAMSYKATYSGDGKYNGSTGPCEPLTIKAGQGCTPGYWKNHTSKWVGYVPTQTVGSVFSNASPYQNNTLLQALSFQGGPGVNGAKQILLRAAVSALLNSTSVNYPLTTAQVISQVNAALGSNDRTTILNLATLLDGYNNATCPLN